MKPGRLFNAAWRPRLRAWWIVCLPAVMRAIDKICDAHAKYLGGQRW